MNKENINVLFLGDIFGEPGIKILENNLPSIKEKYNIDFIIAQAENVSGRKGFEPKDYERLKSIGINAFTLGNHVWAKEKINIKDSTIAIMSFMGITFNPLLHPWEEEQANNFFDKFDELYEQNKTDYYIIDFHAETTAEKSVFSLYVDGKVDAFFGTHTHVQTNDGRILPKGTYYLTDAGMCGPTNCAIGSNFQEVYEKMRYNSFVSFKVSKNKCQINGIVFTLTKNPKDKKFQIINIQEN